MNLPRPFPSVHILLILRTLLAAVPTGAGAWWTPGPGCPQRRSAAAGARRPARGGRAGGRCGRYRLTAPAAGTYRLRTERVGFATAEAATVTLADGQTLDHDLRAESRRVVLEASAPATAPSSPWPPTQVEPR
jgi:hypothetical protein